MQSNDELLSTLPRQLVSDEAAFVHGTTLGVDGGITATRLG